VADDVNAVIGVQVDTDQATAQLRALQAQIQQFSRGMAKSSGTAAKAQRDFEKDLLSNINASKQWNASFRTMADTTSQFATALDKNKLSMGEYFKYGMGATRTFGRAFDKEMRTVNSLAERRVKSLQTQYIQLGKDAQGMMRTIAITPNNLDFSKYGTQMAMVGQRQQIFNDLVKKGSTELINFGKNTQWAGRQLMVGFTLPLAAFGAIAGKTFMELEEAAIKFRRVYGDLFTTSAETDRALKGVEDLAASYTKYGLAVKDTISLAADLAAAGYQGAKLNEAIIQTNRLATLGNLDQQTAMKTTISLQNAFQISSQELAGTINFLNAVENQTVVSLQDLTAAIPRVAPVIKGLGGDVQDLAVFLAAMEEGGISAEQGANALKSGLASLINPSRAAKDMLGGLGINIQAIVDANQGDLMGTVKAFGSALQTLSDFQKQQVLEKLFGKYQYARLGALFNNIVKDGSQANKAMELATSSAIELAYIANRELKAVEDATSTRFVKAIEDIKTAIAPIGKIFLQIVTPVIEFGTRALEAFNGLDDGVKRIIAGIITVIAGVGPVLLMTVGLIANGIGNFLKFINLIRNAFLKMTGQYKGVAGGSQILTEAQLQGVAAADSLAAAEGRVTKSLLVQRDAVLGLASAYAQTLSGARGGMGFLGATQGKPTGVKGYANGVVSVPGSGKGDTVPAMLSPGEAVIPADMAKKYGPLINAMVSGQIPGYSEGLGIKSGTQFAHVNDTVEMSLLDFTRRLEEAGVQLSQGVQRWLDDARKIAQGQGGASPQDLKIRVGSGLGFSQDPALNRGMRDGGRVSVDDFVADFKSEGPEKWSQSMKNVGQSFSEVEKDLAIYDAAILDGIESWKRQTGAIDISTEEFSKIESAVRKDVLAPTSKLKIALDTAASQVHDLRFNVNQDVVKGQGFDLANVESKKTPGKISATKKIVGTMLRTGGNRKSGTNRMFQGLTFQDVGLTAEGMVDEAATKTAKAQKSSSPAELSAGLGDDWAKGYAQGIDRSASQAARASGDMVEETFKITDKRSSAMIGSLPATPQSAQAAIDAQYGSQQPAKRGMGSKMAGFALRKMKIDQDSLDSDAQKLTSTKSQTDAIDGETKARRTSMEGFKTLNGRLMAGSFAVDSVAIGMSMMGGEVGEMGQKLLKMSSMVTMVSMVLPLLTSPIGLLTVLVGGLVAGYMLQKAAQEAATKTIIDSAQKQADAMEGSALAVAEFGKAVGMQSMAEKAQQRRLGSEQATIFFQALTGGEMASTLSSYRESRASSGRQTTSALVAQDVQNLAMQYDFTSNDVESYISAVAEALGDTSLTVDIRAQLVDMLYSDGTVKKNLLDDPSIPIDVVAQVKSKDNEPGGLARSVSGGINDTTAMVDRLIREQLSEQSMNDLAKELGFNDAKDLATNLQMATDYNKATGLGKVAKFAGLSGQASGLASLQTRAKGETSLLPGSEKFMSPEDASSKLAQIQAVADQYSQSLSKAMMSTNLVFKEMDNQKTALELLKQEYETTNMTMAEFKTNQDEINLKQAALSQTLRDQAAAAKEAGTFDDWMTSTANILSIQVAASDASDALKTKFDEMATSVKDLSQTVGNEDVELNFTTAFKNFDGSLEDFLIQWETVQAAFKDKEVASEVSVFFAENSIDVEYVDALASALGGLHDVGVEVLVDGELTQAAVDAMNAIYQAAQVAAGLVDAAAPNVKESRGLITKTDWSWFKDKPGKTGTDGTDGTKDDTDKGSGSGGKKKKDTWVQKRQKEWNKVQAKIKLEEAEIDASYTKNFSDNLNSNLRSAGLLNSNGQLIINLPGAALNLGNITSQESLDAVRKKIELQLLNLEEKKIPHEKKIKALNKEISANNRIQELNKRKIDQINKSYENQSKALEQVSKIQDYMNRQRQAQTSLAEALSGGDLAAAVKAAQAAQAEQTNFIMQNQKDALDSQRDAATFAYEEQNRLIDDLNLSLQDQIYNEERVLEGIQDQVDAYNEVTSAIDRAVKKMELLRDITKSAIVVQGPGGGLVTSSQAAANADIFGAADAVLGDKGTKANYYKSLDQAGYDQQILAGASAQLAALNAAKDAFNVSLKSDSLNALTQSIIDGLRQATFNVSGLSASAGASGITATSSSNVYNSTSAPVYNISINVSNSNASPQDIASAVNQTIRSYNY
jgi:TP901 family phage tail tape measure protein